MPKVIVISGKGGCSVFDLYKSTTIGRGEDCDLILPNVSVSREHARMLLEGDEVRIEDLGSANGVRIAQQKVETATIEPGDEIRVGRFTLVLLAEGERFYNGRYIGYMPEHTGAIGAHEQETLSLAPEQLEELERERRIINNGRIVLANNARRFWLPEDRKLTFGGGGMVPVDGFLTGGIVAEVAWDGRAHILRKLSAFVTVKLNSSKVGESALASGDQVQIGKTSFRYEVAD